MEPTTAAKEPQSDLSQQEFSQLVAKANAGDAEALAELRRILDSRPDIWLRIGDLAAHAELAMIKALASGNQLTSESLKRKAEELRKRLAGPSATPLEELAVGRIVACWLQVQRADALFAASEGGAIPTSKFLLKQQDQAHRRYLAAVRSVMDIRRLLPKAIEMPASTADSAVADRIPLDGTDEGSEDRCYVIPMASPAA